MASDGRLYERVKRYMAERGVEEKDSKELRQMAEEALAKLSAIPLNRPEAHRMLRLLEGRGGDNG